jgi:outer membrane protein TolC
MEADERNQALAAAETAQKLSLTLYTGGLTDYLDVVVAQETALSADVATVEVRTAQLQASVNLIRSLGGGWSRQDMPSLQAVMPFSPLGGGIDKSLETPEQDNLTGNGKGA